MLEHVLFLISSVFLLLLGISVSLSFAGVEFNKKNFLKTLCFTLLALTVHGVVYYFFRSEGTRKAYPLIVHLPLVLFLWGVFKKKFLSSVAAVMSAYLCCQLGNWLGILFRSLGVETVYVQLIKIVAYCVFGFIIIKFLSPSIQKLFDTDRKNVLLFGIMPFVYYIFDYFTGTYADLFKVNSTLVLSFFPLAFCSAFLLFCVVFYKEHEKKTELERKDQLISIQVLGQQKEIESVKRREKELKIIRHDLRHLLRGIAAAVEAGDMESARKLLDSYTTHVEATAEKRFCDNVIVNYILMSFCAQCSGSGIEFKADVALTDLPVDEVLFATVLSNALDNAVNAQEGVEEGKKQVEVMLKNSDGKILLSVKNPVSDKVKADGNLLKTTEEGHGYGTQSMKYLTELMGGNYQFSLQDGFFLFRLTL